MKLNNSLGQVPPVDLSNTTEVSCEKCEGSRFSLTFKIKKVSALVAPNGQEGFLPIQTYECSGCGHINEEFDA